MRKRNDKMNTNWIRSEWPFDDNMQLRLFPPTRDEIVEARLNDFEMQLDKYRKAQFAKIGLLAKKYAELDERFAHIERGLCQMQHKADLQELECEIIEMVGQ